MGSKHNPQAGPVSGDGVRDERRQQTVRVTLVGAAVDLVLGAVKIAFGFSAHSQALIADGIHSLSDLATDAMVLYAAKHASRKADAEHPYGHGRIETVTTVGLGIALIAVAIGLSLDAVRRLFSPELLLHPGPAALVVAAVSIVSKEAIYHYTMFAARKFHSPMLRANAWHSRSDAISSVIVFIGVGGAMLGLDYLDALAAIGVALMIAKIGWDLVWHSLRELVDTGLDPERVETIRHIILSVDGVEGLHTLRTRRMGGEALADVHIQVKPTLSVSEGHQISDAVRCGVIDNIDEISDITVHIDAEDDQFATPGQAPPLRSAVMQRIMEQFREIEAARHIDNVTLHYLEGKIRVEILLPLDLVKDNNQAARLAARFREAVKNDHDIASVDVAFH